MQNIKYAHIILIGFGDIYKRALRMLIDLNSKYNYSLEVIENEPYPTSRISSVCSEHNIEYHKILGNHMLTEYFITLKDKYGWGGGYIERKTLLISAGNKYIFPSDVLKLSGLTVINFHNALLPKYPGRNAPSWAIYNGETTAGATWHYVTPDIDAGDIIWQKSCIISEDTKAYELAREIMELAFEGLKEIMPLLLEGKVKAQKQDVAISDRKIYYSKDTPANGIIRLTDAAEDVYRILRAMDFGPNMIFQRPVLEMSDGTRYSVRRYKKIPASDKADDEQGKCYYMDFGGNDKAALKICVSEYISETIQMSYTPPKPTSITD